MVKYFFFLFLQDSLEIYDAAKISLINATTYLGFCLFLPETQGNERFRGSPNSNNPDIENNNNNQYDSNGNNIEKQTSLKNLYTEIKKSSVLYIIGLIMIEQLIGGISILFYIKYFAQLTGNLFYDILLKIHLLKVKQEKKKKKIFMYVDIFG